MNILVFLTESLARAILILKKENGFMGERQDVKLRELGKPGIRLQVYFQKWQGVRVN